MNHIAKLRDQQKAGQHPGHAIGQFLIEHTNSLGYLIGQLEAYLEAARADMEAEREFHTRMMSSIRRAAPP